MDLASVSFQDVHRPRFNRNDAIPRSCLSSSSAYISAFKIDVTQRALARPDRVLLEATLPQPSSLDR